MATRSARGRIETQGPSGLFLGRLAGHLGRRCTGLSFAEDCFAPLSGVPFARSAATRFVALLDILDRLARAFDETGIRSAEGHRIVRDFFTGDRALFTDSSVTEKREFRRELTFSDPTNPSSCLEGG